MFEAYLNCNMIYQAAQSFKSDIFTCGIGAFTNIILSSLHSWQPEALHIQ